MKTPLVRPPILESPQWPVVFDDIPILYEDEEEGDMGEANVHVLTDEILHVCLCAHLEPQPQYQVYSNMNLYYRDGPPHKVTGSLPYVSPDVMVVAPFEPLPQDVISYRIGREGPAPLLVTEILSERSAQQRDLKEKLTVYAKLKVREYILVDITGKFLPEKLLLKRLQPDGTWEDVIDRDGGVTSELGFRIIIDTDGNIRLLDAKAGRPYVRPKEAESEGRARRKAEQLAATEADARRQAEQMAATEADARRQAEQMAATEADARRQAEQMAATEADARRQAEQMAATEADARRQAEARLQALEAELARLRSGNQDPEKT